MKFSFCVQENDNELIDMIERLRAQYPHVDSQLFVGKYHRRVKANLPLRFEE